MVTTRGRGWRGVFLALGLTALLSTPVVADFGPGTRVPLGTVAGGTVYWSSTANNGLGGYIFTISILTDGSSTSIGDSSTNAINTNTTLNVQMLNGNVGLTIKQPSTVVDNPLEINSSVGTGGDKLRVSGNGSLTSAATLKGNLVNSITGYQFNGTGGFTGSNNGLNMQGGIVTSTSNTTAGALGTLNITAPSAGAFPLVVQAFAGQTASIVKVLAPGGSPSYLTVTNNGKVSISQLATNTRTVTTATDTATITDKLIECNAVSNAITETMPTPSSTTGQEFLIFKTDSSANIVTVSATVLTSPTLTISTQGGFIRLISDGTQYLKE